MNRNQSMKREIEHDLKLTKEIKESVTWYMQQVSSPEQKALSKTMGKDLKVLVSNLNERIKALETELTNIEEIC